MFSDLQTFPSDECIFRKARIAVDSGAWLKPRLRGFAVDAQKLDLAVEKSVLQAPATGWSMRQESIIFKCETVLFFAIVLTRSMWNWRESDQGSPFKRESSSIVDTKGTGLLHLSPVAVSEIT